MKAAFSIHQLPPDLAAKIAAGEVIERPASVIKELVENAIDAGATQIRVDISGGGLQMMRVIDNGSGIPQDELALAFSRHATSKIAGISDLERISTLGFRGEALASIAAVADVTLASMARDADHGAKIRVREGTTSAAEPVGTARGTTITVNNLFSNVPARLKFLKSSTTEVNRCAYVLQQFALAYPEIRFSVFNDTREMFATSGSGDLKQAIVEIYGLKTADKMLPLTWRVPNENPDGDEQDLIVSGYTSDPSLYKSTRASISFFVNKRWVASRTLTYAVEEAYHSLLLTGRHPIAVINIEIDPQLIDVNVHPAKTEIKFLRERQVYAAVQRAARAAVIEQTAAPDISRNSFSLPAFERYDEIPVAGTEPETDETVQPNIWGQTRIDSTLPSAGAKDSQSFRLPSTGQIYAGGSSRIPLLRVLGQVSQSYIITEGPDGMYLIDQHAAHERILLEQMVADWKSQGMSSQLLLEPISVELSAAEYEMIEEHLASLQSIGFQIEAFGQATFLVRSVPAVLAKKVTSQSLHDLLLEMSDKEDSHGETWEEHALANVACKAAIKAGQALSTEEQRELIQQMENTEARFSCCHGRPTMVHLSLSALEREFARR